MAEDKLNSGFDKWHGGHGTNTSLVMDAMNDRSRFVELMVRYRKSSWGYLDWFLLHHRIVIEQDARRIAVRSIWDKVLEMMPERLTTKWSKGNIGFRVLLCETIHESCFEWQKISAYRPGIDGLASPVPGDDAELLRQQRAEVLDRARQRLRLKDLETESELYRAFITWEADKLAARNTLHARMAMMTGCRTIDPQDFRKTLSRAWEVFGRYLAEEVEELFNEKEQLSVEKFRDAFERLDLMEDYALKSKHCRCLLKLPEEK